jgi:SAM-dependent methyltransferase
MENLDFTYSTHPEKGIDGFTVLDGTVRFYGFVNAILLKTNAINVLDFGAGRGAAFFEDRSAYRLRLRDLRTLGATVTACDVDGAVLGHPASDHRIVIKAGEPLPFSDGQFDVIVSDTVFEHIEDPRFLAIELMRILRLGGFLCVRTPNALGYVRIFSGLIPSSLQMRLLARAQPNRKKKDVFPAVYRMNSLRVMRHLFPTSLIFHYYDASEPAYYFNSRVLYHAFAAMHKVMPSRLASSVCFFIKKTS